MPGLVWENPPRKKSSTQIQAERLAREVAARPGDWALLATYPRTSAGRSSAYSRRKKIRDGALLGWSEVGTFDALVRSTPDGYKLYVKCMHRKDNT